MEIGDIEEWWWTGHNDNDWQEIEVPSHWQDKVFPNYDGIVWYRLLFDLNDEFKREFGPRIILRFNGVFYKSQIWLNNEYLGEHEGYFDEFEFDISDLVDENNNLLCVKVICFDEKDINKKVQLMGVFSHWDASEPNFNPGGIWNDVELVKKREIYLKDLQIRTKIVDKDYKKADLKLNINIDSLITADVKLKFEISPRNFQGESIFKEISRSIEPGITYIEETIEIMEPRLWWTHDHGYPNLYDLKIYVDIEGKIMDVIETFFGIKEFTLKRKKGWEFYLNGERIFIKGSNYAPQDMRLAYSTREDYENDVRLMKKCNFNMIRVHAHIDRKELHEITSEEGILVWQDFPLQWYYRKSVKKSIKKQAERIISHLRNYPSQAVWCCHNEPFKMLDKKEALKILLTLIVSIGLSFLSYLFMVSYLFFNIVIADILSILIGLGFFLLGSLILELIPTSIFIYNWNRNVLDAQIAKLISKIDQDHPVIKASGLIGKSDLHWYDGWYLNPGKFWKANKLMKGIFRKLIPFVSEYGAQSFPNIQNLKKYEIELNWPFDKETWKNLKVNYRCQYKIFNRIFKMKKFENLEDFIEATQQYQSDLLKYYNELWRKMRFKYIGGALTFQFNDCAPLITWSILDYYGTPKKAFESVALSFEPVYSFLKKWPRKYKRNTNFKNILLLVNDYLEPIEDVHIKIQVFKPDNTVIYKNEIKTDIGPNEITEILDLNFKIPDVEGDYLLKINLEYEDIKLQNCYKFKIV